MTWSCRREHEGDHGENGPEEEEDPEMPQIEVFRMALLMASKKKEEVLKTISERYLTLRADGFVVRQIHTDRGGEFMSRQLQAWCRNRDILRTHTTGSDSKLNGRAERAALEIKNRVRTLLHGAGVDQSWWPIAVRNVNERWRLQRIHRKDEAPPFLAEVLMKKVVAGWGAGSHSREGEVPVSIMGRPRPLGGEAGRHKGPHALDHPWHHSADYRGNLVWSHGGDGSSGGEEEAERQNTHEKDDA